MIKKLTAVLLCICLTLGLSACGGKGESAESGESPEISIPIQTADVTVTIPNSARKKCGSFFTDNAAKLEISIPERQEDGSLIFTCKSENRDLLLRNAKLIFSDILDSVKSSYHFISRIEADREFTTVTVLADRVIYDAPSGSFFKTVYIPLIACVALSGKSDFEIDGWVVEFVFLDKDSLSVISRFIYPSDDVSESVYY